MQCMIDTVGIIYQFYFEQTEDPHDVEAATSSNPLIADTENDNEMFLHVKESFFLELHEKYYRTIPNQQVCRS